MPGRQSIDSELRDGARVLEEAGILIPKREATAIWASLVGVQSSDVWLTRDKEAPELVTARFRCLLSRRAAGEPLPYVVGATGFRTLDLKVDKRALIPRPETEGLVHCVLDWCKNQNPSSADNWGLAVDVGTGSGCIALSLAAEGLFERIVAIDNSDSALELAAENLSLVAPNTPVEFRRGSLLEPLGSDVANIIVSNPPYVTAAEYSKLDRSVTGFEPRDALVSDEDGMAHTKRLLETAAGRLISGGLIAIEVDSTRANMAHDLARSLAWPNARIEADLYGRPRFLLANKEI